MHQYAISSVSNLFLQALQAIMSSNPPQRLTMTERQPDIELPLSLCSLFFKCRNNPSIPDTEGLAIALLENHTEGQTRKDAACLAGEDSSTLSYVSSNQVSTEAPSSLKARR